MRTRLAVLLAALTGLACARTVPLALSPVPASDPDAPFAAAGEVHTKFGSASFDGWHVVGPQVNLSRRPDGSWGGELLGHAYDLKPGEGSLLGSGVDLHFVRWGKELVFQGYVGARRVHIRVIPGPGIGGSGGCLCQLAGGLVDCRREAALQSRGIALAGEATHLDVPVLPQLGLALVATLMLPDRM